MAKTMASVLYYLGDMFPDKCILEDREPVATFGIPGAEGTFGLLLPKSIFWVMTITYALVLVLLQLVAAIAIYYSIVKRRGTITSYLFGYGVVIPMAFHVATLMLEYLDIHNKDQKIIPSMLTTVIVCRCLEAMHGTSPPVVEYSLGNYMTYYSTMVHCYWDDKTHTRVPITPFNAFLQLLRVAFMFVALSILGSFLLHFNFQVFNSPVELNSFYLSWGMLHPGHLANCYLLGCVYLLLISFALNTAAFGENFQGYATPPVFMNPLFASTSPSDFWGRKWNLTIHRNLKGAVFLPLRRKHGFSAPVASFLTFAVSGILHDFYTSLVFYKHKRHSMPEETGFWYVPAHSKMVAFFLYNWTFIMLERPVGRMLPKWVKKLPVPVRSTMIVLLALPVSHWFTSQWALGGFFHDLSQGLFHIVRIDID